MVGSVKCSSTFVARASGKETRGSSNQDMCHPWWLTSVHLLVLKLNLHAAICELTVNWLMYIPYRRRISLPT
jgi:hypothetical protein